MDCVANGSPSAPPVLEDFPSASETGGVEQVKRYEFKPRKEKTPRHNLKRKLCGRMEPSSNLTKEYNLDKFKKLASTKPSNAIFTTT